MLGPSGAGKSTIADLCIRLYDPSAGSISLLDGVDLKELRLEDLRQLVAVVEQVPFLTHATIAGERRKPPVLILDEPTSVLDADTEARLGQSLRSNGLTLLIVTHRRDLLDLADQVGDLPSQ